MSEFSLLAVFLVGLLSGVHCIGMCGSIVGMLTAQLPRSAHGNLPSPQPSPACGRGGNREKPFSILAFHLSYNAGRLASYAVAGALVGTIGQAGLLLRDEVPVQHLLFALSSLMLIALGLYLAGIWSMVQRIERAGGLLWRHIQPMTRHFLPVATPWRALMLGTLWGWLPCGLVYSVLLTSLASGSAPAGALIMLAFGLGTLPNLLAIGLFWEKIRRLAQSRHARLLAGALVAGFGVYGLIKVGYTFHTYGWSGSCHVAA